MKADTAARAAKLMRRMSFIKKEMEKTISVSRSEAVWNDATERLADILGSHDDLPSKVRAHTDKYIFPCAAIYLSLKESEGQKTAYSIVENATAEVSGSAGRMLARLMRVPGMKDLFVGIWEKISKRVYGPDSGFGNVFYPPKKGEYRMDIVSCPYCTYFAQLGCFELTKIFCDNDDRVYGHLPGLEFRRTGTLGRGDSRCDFFIRKV